MGDVALTEAYNLAVDTLLCTVALYIIGPSCLRAPHTPIMEFKAEIVSEACECQACQGSMGMGIVMETGPTSITVCCMGWARC
jgi:hypothetical protein